MSCGCSMEEPGEQCTVVFAEIVTESGLREEMGGGGGCNPHPSAHKLTISVTFDVKTTMHCSSGYSMGLKKKVSKFKYMGGGGGSIEGFQEK
jgi:hypothetical protein